MRGSQASPDAARVGSHFRSELPTACLPRAVDQSEQEAGDRCPSMLPVLLGRKEARLGDCPSKAEMKKQTWALAEAWTDNHRMTLGGLRAGPTVLELLVLDNLVHQGWLKAGVSPWESGLGCKSKGYLNTQPSQPQKALHPYSHCNMLVCGPSLCCYLGRKS